MPSRILIWGADRAPDRAWLKRAGHDISFVDVVPEHVAAISGDGLRITGPVEQFTVAVPAFLPVWCSFRASSCSSRSPWPELFARWRGLLRW